MTEGFFSLRIIPTAGASPCPTRLTTILSFPTTYSIWIAAILCLPCRVGEVARHSRDGGVLHFANHITAGASPCPTTYSIWIVHSAFRITHFRFIFQKKPVQKGSCTGIYTILLFRQIQQIQLLSQHLLPFPLA